MGKDGKPRGKMSSYAFFVQTCREEHRKKHAGEQVVFAEFSKKCAEKWKAMGAKGKRRFEEMALKDKARFEHEVAKMPQRAKGVKGGKRKRAEDPDAPKLAMSAFFFFCNEETPKVMAMYPEYAAGDIAKELGKRWELCPNKLKFESLAVEDKQRYEEEIGAYRRRFGARKGAKKAKMQGKMSSKQPEEEESD